MYCEQVGRNRHTGGSSREIVRWYTFNNVISSRAGILVIITNHDKC